MLLSQSVQEQTPEVKAAQGSFAELEKDRGCLKATEAQCKQRPAVISDDIRPAISGQI